jgi:uncharacterized membrane protein
MATTVSEMTIEEFKILIEEIIEQKIVELIKNFDEEQFQVRETVRERLLQQKIATAAGERGQPLEKVVQQLGL